MKSIPIKDLSKHYDEEVTISGFVDEIRNLKWVQFIVLRDATSKVQITIEKSEEANKAMVELVDELTDKGFRIEIDDRNEKIGYKIREAQLQKVPYMLVVGDKEIENNQVGVRSRKDGDIGAMSIRDFEEKLDREVKNFER